MRRAGLQRGAEAPVPVHHAQRCSLSAGRRIWWSGNFVADRPDALWVADVTYVPTAEGFLYLAVVLDVFSRFDGRVGDGRVASRANWCRRRLRWRTRSVLRAR